VDMGDPEVVLWGSPIELSAQDRVRALRDWVLRSRLFPAFAMSDDAMDGFLRGIRRIRPRMLFGYPSALALLAERARRRGITMDDLGVRVAFVTGERLYPEQRSMIEQVFAARVANGYGGRDAGFVAHECPAGSLHISAEDVIVETVDPQGRPVRAGEPGEIVVTHLATRAFPFIRYRTGDWGMLDSRACPCGRGLPLLREVQGRATDFVQAADGTLMHGLALIYAVRDQPGIRRFKIIQESRALTRLLVVADGEFPAMVADRIRRAFRARLGDEVDVRIDLVADIPPERSGKYRYVESHAHVR
jgi:phenylacetate-CoA ligase